MQTVIFILSLSSFHKHIKISCKHCNLGSRIKCFNCSFPTCSLLMKIYKWSLLLMYTHFLHLEPRVIPPLCCPLFSNCWTKLLRWILKGKGEGKNTSAMICILFHKRLFYLFGWHQTFIKYFFFCMKRGTLSHIVRFFWFPKEKPCENTACMSPQSWYVWLPY